MVDLYVRLIKAGMKTIDDVPWRLREAVEKKLKKEDYQFAYNKNTYDDYV